MRTAIDLDGHMRQSAQIFQSLLVRRGLLRRVGNHRHDHRSVAGADLPEMQIGQPVAAGLNTLTDPLRQRRVGHRIEEDAAGRPDQGDRPGQDDEHTGQTDHWVNEVQAERPGHGQAGNRQHGSERIGQHVDISRTVVGIVLGSVTMGMFAVRVIVVRTVVVRMVAMMIVVRLILVGVMSVAQMSVRVVMAFA